MPLQETLGQLVHGGPNQHTQQQKARVARNGPAQQRRREKRASARATQEGAQAGAAAAENEDATAKEGPTGRVDNAVETYAGKVRVSAAGMRTD